MKQLKKLIDFFHLHRYDKIIKSKYHSFNYRDVIVECRCGERKRRIQDHDKVYPFLTDIGITEKEMEDALNKVA